MLHEMGILALSPELGIDDHAVEKFFIKDARVLEGLVVANSAWIKDAMNLLMEKVSCELKESKIVSLSLDQKNREMSKVQSNFICTNEGLLGSTKSRFIMYKNTELGVDILRSYLDDEQVKMECPFENTSKYQRCEVELSTIGAQSKANFSVTSYVESAKLA